MTYQEFRTRYEFDMNSPTDKLGAGGQGSVYKAYDRERNETVAIKKLDSNSLGSDKYSLVRECELGLRLPAHPNIVIYRAAYSFTTEFGTMEFAVLSYYPKGSLADLLKRNPKGLRPELAQPLMLGILEGLKLLHKEGIVHRDLKPGNVLLAYRDDKDEYIPLIGDFGISKQASQDHSHISNSGVGTLPYRSPEQYSNQVITAQSDLWSAGTLFYEMLTGRRMFDGNSDTDILTAITTGKIPSDLGQVGSVAQRRLITSCMVTETSKRLKSAEEGIRILKEEKTEKESNPTTILSQGSRPNEQQTVALSTVQRSHTPPKPTATPPSNIPETKKSSFWIWTMAIVAALLVVVLWMSQHKGHAYPLRDDISGIVMIPVEGGTFSMGCSDHDGFCRAAEGPEHQVTVDGFLMAETEVTQIQWQLYMGINPSQFSGCDQCPVENVSYNDALAFIERINQGGGRQYRLPTEAEWEFAAKGGILGSGRKYAGSHDADQVGWYKDNTNKTRPVKSKYPNELGLYDMTGNVWEWCSDWEERYSGREEVNPQGPSFGTKKSIKGGAWLNEAKYVRCASRYSASPGYKGSDVGLRLCSSR